MIEPGDFLRIYVAKGDSAFDQFRTSDWPALALSGGPVILQRGFRRSVSGYLYYAHAPDPDKQPHGAYLFETPGLYRLKAILTDMKGQNPIESNTLTIEIKEPRGEDAAAYELLKALKGMSDRNVSYGGFLMRDFGRQYHPRWEAFIDKQEELLSRFPKRQYARYAEYSLGLTYSRRDDEQDVQRGISLLKKASRHSSFFLAEDALRALRGVKLKRGQREEAKEYEGEMAARFPNSPEGRDYLERQYILEEKKKERHEEQQEQQKQEEKDEKRALTWPVGLGGALGIVIVVGLVVGLKKWAART
ncbi:MAG TPA: hypothetical protein VMX13_11195 [Sedimentisphaerales bacterium]|nr:hypothetical protein [Sedimentisphaerales bacterium]